MRKITLRDRRSIYPFNEPARDLRFLNKPLWLHQRDILSPFVGQEREVQSFDEIPQEAVETLVYRENLFFDRFFVDEFLSRARKLQNPRSCR